MNARRGVGLLVAVLVLRVVVPLWYGRDASAWLEGKEPSLALARELVRFEAEDSAHRTAASGDRFEGEWALVTHQMTALGLGQVLRAHPDRTAEFGPTMRQAALRSWLPEMRDFGTRAWGEDALESLSGNHGHAYQAYPALAVGMARWIDPLGFPADVAREHDLLIEAYERRLLASPVALIETYPDEAFPTDVAAVAAAIAMHGRATGVDHSRVLEHWVAAVRRTQVDPESGFVHQRMGLDGRAHDVPRGSGTGLAAYYAGFVDRGLAEQLTRALLAHERTFWGFSGVAEFDAREGHADIDSGPVVLGVSVAATGFSLAPFRAFGHRDAFTRVFRTTSLFGLPREEDGRLYFRTGGPIGNALLLAMLTSGAEVSP